MKKRTRMGRSLRSRIQDASPEAQKEFFEQSEEFMIGVVKAMDEAEKKRSSNEKPHKAEDEQG